MIKCKWNLQLKTLNFKFNPYSNNNENSPYRLRISWKDSR